MTQVMQIKFNEPVWHDTPYIHPQLRTEVIQDFFDRIELKTQLRTRLAEGSARLTLIQGERRSGKTSMLRLLEYDLKMKPNGDFLPLWLPWQGVDSRDSLANELLESCAFELDMDLPFFVPDGFISDEIVVSALGQLAAESGKTIVFFIDEFDSIVEQSPITEGVGILKLINALITTNFPLNLVMTLVKIPDTASNQMFSKSKTWSLEPFPLEDMKVMLKALMSISGKDLSLSLLPELYRLSGGWPYFAKLLLMSLIGQEESSDLKAALESTIEHPLLERVMDHIYSKHFSWHEQRVVLRLAMSDRQALTAAVLADEAETELAVSNLIQRHYLSRLPNGDICFRIGLLSHWFPQWIRFQEEVETHTNSNPTTGDNLLPLHPGTAS